jgi:uncharacterized protein (TIGR00369 family)
MSSSSIPTSPSNKRSFTSAAYGDPGSAFADHVGHELTEWTDGHARMELAVEAHHLNRHDRVHGGVILTILDDVGGRTGCYCPVPGHYRMSATISFTCNFLQAAKTHRLIAQGRMVKSGRRSYTSLVEMRDAEGNLVAVGQGAYRYASGSEKLEGVPRPQTGAASLAAPD